jgi:hypothetical protein
MIGLRAEVLIMRGDTVIVRSYGGVPLLRKVWEDRGPVVDIVSEENFQLLEVGDPRAIGPIGFPKEDVYRFDAKFSGAIERNDLNWGMLIPEFV